MLTVTFSLAQLRSRPSWTGGADFTGGDVRDQCIAVLHWLPVDGDDDVEGLDSGLGSRAVGWPHFVDQHAAIGEAVFTANCVGERSWKLMPMEPRTTL